MARKAGSKKTSAKQAKKLYDKTICFNPATGEKLGEVRVDTVEELNEAVRKARIAQPAWAALPVKKRALQIKKIRGYMMDNLDEIAEVISRDNGKPRIDALAAEVVAATMALTYYCKKAPEFLRDKKLAMGNILFFNKRSRIVRIPFGVIGIISPWNYPYAIPFSEIIMALLAGNAVIFKAASEAQMVGQALKKSIEAAGLPHGIFNYINMPGSVAGDAFLDAGIDKLFFTGSVNTGKYLMKKASETLTPVSLELGGNDPMIVCKDADLSRAATGAVWAGYSNAGQSCGGVERIYVERPVYDEFLRLLKKEVEALRVGYDTDFNIDIGAMTTVRQMETVNAHIKDALKKGARIYAESRPPAKLKGQFLPCTVLVDVNHEMAVMREETFGPVVGVMPVDSIEGAVILANDSHLGLTASVWSKNHKKAAEIGRRLKAGAITINDHLMSHGVAETPWGGFKQSSIGRTHGELGFDEMTQPQVIVNDIMPFVRKNFWWHPYSKNIYEGLKGAANVLYGKGILSKLKGLFKLTRVFPRTFWPN